MKKFRFLSVILVLLILLSTFSLSVSAAPDNRTKLAEAISHADFEAIPPGSNYTGESTKALFDASEEAKKVYYDVNATEKELEEQIKKLYSAVYHLESLNIYTTALWKASQFVDTLNPEDYTDESFKALKEASSVNGALIYFPNSQKEVDDATAEINNAVAGLVPVGNATVPVETAKDKLQRFLDRADHYLHDYTKIYTVESIDALQQAYDNGEKIIDAENVTDNLLLNIAYSIEEALSGLEVYNWYTDGLDEIIIDAHLIDYESDYTADSYKNFRNALYNAKSARNNAASQKEIDDAAKALINAMSALELSSTGTEYDKTEYSRFINLLFEARKYTAGYTEESLENLAEVIKNCENSEFATYRDDEYFTPLADSLESAIASLIPEPENTVSTAEAESSTASAETTVIATETTEETSSAITEATEITTSATEPTTATFDEPEETETASVITEPAKTESSSTEATIPAGTIVVGLYYTLGDADTNSKVNIKDATAVQKHIAKLTALSELGSLAGDTTEDGKLNIKDATEIQKHIANLPSNENIGKKFSTADSPSETTAVPFSTEVTTAGTTMAETIATEVSSQDEIPAETTSAVSDVTEPEETVTASTVAIDVTEATETTTETSESTETTVNETITETTAPQSTTESVPVTTEKIEETTETVPVSDDATIYFTNSQKWDEVNIHYWGKNIDATKWPGIPMEFVETNTYNEDIYKITIPSGVEGVVFNAGMDKPQTHDVLGPFESKMGFYPDEISENKWTTGTFVYDGNTDKPQITEIDFEVVKDERLFEGYGSEQTMFFVVKDSSDTDYKNHIIGEAPELDTATLSQRGKAIIVMLNFLRSGSNTQTIDKLEADGNTLTIVRKVRTTIIGTADMNYRFVAIEVNASDLENITNFEDAEIFDIEY